MSTFYLSDSLEDLEQTFSGADIEAANQMVLDKLQIALDVLDYAPDEAVTIAANSQGSQLTAEYSADPSADWSGDARIVVDGTGLSTDPEDGDFTISGVNVILTSSEAPSDWDKPLAEVDLGLQLTVVNDRAQSLMLNSVTVTAGEMRIGYTGPVSWSESTNIITTENARFEVSADTDPSDLTELSSFYIEGDLTLDLDAESLTGKIKKMGVTNEGEGGHHLYSDDLNISLTELFEFDGADIDPELTDHRLSGFWGYSDEAGDLNGDGWDDLLVHAGGQNMSNEWVNHTYLIFGDETGWGGETIDLSTLNSSDGQLLDFSATPSLSSASVQPLGDLNGDGYAELSVNANGKWENNSWSSKNLVLFGKVAGWQTAIDLSDLSEDNGFEWNIAGHDSSIHFRIAGDLNGDGVDDIWVEAGNHGSSGNWEQSHYLLFGKATGWEEEIDLSLLNGTDGFRFGDPTEDYLHIEPVGDMNEDGVDDLLIDTHDTHGATSDEYVLLGRSAGWEASVGLEDLADFDAIFLPRFIFPDSDDILYTSGNVTLPEGIENVEVQGDLGLTLEGNSQDNRMVGGGGHDTFDGGTGSDTVVYSGSYTDYTVDANLDTRTITVASNGDGTDTLTAVETLQFSDQNIDVSTLLPQIPTVTFVIEESLRSIDEDTHNHGKRIAYNSKGINVEPGTEGSFKHLTLNTEAIDDFSGWQLRSEWTTADSALSGAINSSAIRLDIASITGVFSTDWSSGEVSYFSDATYNGTTAYNDNGEMLYHGNRPVKEGTTSTVVGVIDSVNNGKSGLPFVIELNDQATPEITEALASHVRLSVRDESGDFTEQWDDVAGTYSVNFSLDNGAGITASGSRPLELISQPESGGVSAETSITAQFWKESVALSGVTLELVDLSDQSSIASTDTNGEALVTVDSTTTITPSLLSDAKAESSVNLQDAILILKQIVGLEGFNGYQTVAADFDQSNDVGLNDAIGILKHVVGLPAPEPEWVFMESAATEPLVDGVLEVTPGDTSVELVGVLLGDVDGSYIA